MRIYYKESLKRVTQARQLCQPTKEDWTSRQYRSLSIFLTLLLAKSEVSANEITVAWIVSGVAGTIALAFPSYWLRVAGAALILFSELLDFVDGELARLKQETSSSGVFLDLLGHDLIKRSLFLAIGYQVFKATNSLAYLLFAFSASVFVSGYQMAPFLAEYAGVDGLCESNRPPMPAQASFLKKSVKPLFFLMRQTKHLIFLGTIFNGVRWVLVYYAFTAPALFLWRVWRLYQQRSRRKRIALQADA